MSDVTCKGGVWSGLQFTRSPKGEIKYNQANCNNKMPPFGDSTMDKACDCELIDAKDGNTTCPKNKFINTHYPLLGKTSCCTPCSADMKTKATYEPKNCTNIHKDKSATDLNCPDNTFLRGISITDNTSKLECCSAKFETNDKTDCEKMGLEICNGQTINNAKNLCREYGLTDCTTKNIMDIEAKCGQFGLRYIDSKDNKHKNTDSYLVCHVDNIDKLSKQCMDKKMAKCDFNELKNAEINMIKNDIGNIDKIQNIYDNKFSKIDNSIISKVFSNRTFLITALVIILFFIIVVLFVVVRK